MFRQSVLLGILKLRFLMFLILVYLRIRKSLYFIKKKVFSSVLVLHFWRQPSHILTPLLINKRSNHPSVSFSHDYHRQSEREREGGLRNQISQHNQGKRRSICSDSTAQKKSVTSYVFYFSGWRCSSMTRIMWLKWLTEDCFIQ